jgi:hypothetical protein
VMGALPQLNTRRQALLYSLARMRQEIARQPRQPEIESICFHALALRRLQSTAELDVCLRILEETQHEDGSWPAFVGDGGEGSWATALALITLFVTKRDPEGVHRAARWLIGASGRESNWFWRWKFETIDNNARFDPRKYGWSWLPRTTSWVTPTSFSLIALENVRRAGLRDDRLNDRVNLGISMLLDRMCPGGGWNAGNGVAFGVALAPYIDATANALLALQSHECEAVDLSLRWLRVRLPYCPSPYSLAWGILALAAYEGKGREFGDSLEEASSRLTTTITEAGRFLNAATLAISTLALSAIDGDNVFAVQP